MKTKLKLIIPLSLAKGMKRNGCVSTKLLQNSTSEITTLFGLLSLSLTTFDAFIFSSLKKLKSPFRKLSAGAWKISEYFLGQSYKNFSENP